jgi:hypothetical protein
MDWRLIIEPWRRFPTKVTRLLHILTLRYKVRRDSSVTGLFGGWDGCRPGVRIICSVYPVQALRFLQLHVASRDLPGELFVGRQTFF